MRYAATVLIFCVAALLSLGLVILFSSSMGVDPGQGRYPVAQAASGLIGILLAAAITAVDYRHLKKFSIPLYVIGAGLLIAVLVHGATIGGATRWLRLPGGQTFQPSELAKVALVVFLAHYADRYSRYMPGFLRGFVVPGMFVLVYLVLIFKEPDWGATVLLATVSGAVALLGGLRWRYVLIPAVLGFVLLLVAIQFNPVRRERVRSWLDPEASKETVAGYQGWQGVVAIGSGGLTGRGLGDSRAKFGSLPVHETDFIFCIIAEELGLAGALPVLAAFAVLILCGFYIAWHARDPFGMLLAAGITLLIGLQACINIGVATAALPNKGIPLPFISRGGSNLVIMLGCVGILLSVARHSVLPARPRTAESLDQVFVPQVT